MFYQISEGTINKTTRCNHNFKCLNDDSFQICPVENPIQEFYFIRKLTPLYKCTYCLSVDNSYICRCPTRKELFERYKVY